MEKTSIKETPRKKRRASTGDRVNLTGSYWVNKSSHSNPYHKSEYACEGTVTEGNSSELYVEWENGERNSYPVDEVTIIEGVELPPTRTVVRINTSVVIGSIEVLKKNTRMYVQGDYAHDEHGTIFLKLDSKYLPKKMFNHPKSKN